MLIDALCRLYDTLADEGKVVKPGYSNVNIHYLIALTPDGRIDDIIDWQETEDIKGKNGKTKQKLVPKEIAMPQRTEKPGIESNIIEHRPLYIFGLNFEGEGFTPVDKTGKAEKSHKSFVEANLNFLEGLDSPIINAYREFILNWLPEDETENEFLLSLGKNYKNSYFAFCLSGRPDILLHEASQIKEKWEQYFVEKSSASEDSVCTQCAVTGRVEPIARIHNKLKGVYGGLAAGNVFIGFKNSASWSYGNEQSYNSNISETAMKKYTSALNYLLKDKTHKNLIDDVTVLFWADGGEKNIGCCEFCSAALFGEATMGKEETEETLNKLIASAREGNVVEEQISFIDDIDENVNFYIVGIKPNSSRVAVKFIYKKRFGDILNNIVQYQSDIQIGDKISSVPLWRLKKELISPKSTNEKVDSSLLAAIFKSILYGTEFPAYLLSALVGRAKTDRSINNIRAGAIKACLNRKSRINCQKEEIKLALDYENKNQAYLCGRLFATLEKIQQEALGNLNRTIKDAYFASAASKPTLVFPKLMSLAQNHLKKLSDGREIYFNKLIQEIVGNLQGEFPETLMLSDQGRFMIGYYQQYQSFFNKVNKEEN